MRKVMSVIGISCLIGSLVFASASQSNQRVPKKVNDKMLRKVEPMNQYQNTSGESGIPVQHNNRNGFSSMQVDESKNGYGMIVAPTKPVYLDDTEGLFFVYRQWAGDTGTSGQIGASLCTDCTDGSVDNVWTTYYNLNGAMEVGRYPSALGTADTPYAIWNEYTGTGAPSYGGRPYYAYDEFDWDGGSFTNPPNDIDLTWSDDKDLWVGSPAHSIDNGMNVVNVAYADWTRGDTWLFHSEAYDDGFLVFGSEIKIIDETADLVGGDDEGSYTSSPNLHINEDGIGYYAVTAYFSGADVDASVVEDGTTHTIGETGGVFATPRHNRVRIIIL